MARSTLTITERAAARATADLAVFNKISVTKNLWVAAYIFLASLVAQLVLLANPTIGVYFNALAFATFIALALWKESVRQVAIAAAIVPVASMISLSLPQSSIFAQTMVFYDAIFLLALIYRFIFTLDQPLSYTKLSAKGYGVSLPIMLVVGECLGVIGYGLLRHHYSFGNTSLPLVAVSAAVFAFAEETLFRGLIQQRAANSMHPVVALLLSAGLYSLTSIGHISVLAPLFALLSGLVLSYTYYKKQNLVLTMVMNATMKLTYIGLLATFVFR